MKKENKNFEQALMDFKQDQYDVATKILIREGGVMPIISILCLDKDNEYGTVIAPIIGDMSALEKDVLVDQIVPEVFSKIKSEGMKPVCFSFTSEAWLRTGPSDMEQSSEAISKLPKEEALIITFETLSDTDLKVFSIKRDGSSVNENGEVVDNIKLEPHSLNDSKNGNIVGGRFSGILKKYTEHD